MAAPRVTRWLRVIAVLMVGLGTTGCAVEGSAVFGADEVVSVDVTTWFLKSEVEADYEVESACELTRNWVRAAPESLTFDPVGAAAGGTEVGCHVVGTVPLEQVPRWFPMGKFGDRYVFSVAGKRTDEGLPSPVSTNGSRHLSITFPTAVIDHDTGATVSGNTVTWTDPGQSPTSMLATAEAPSAGHPEIPLALLGGLAGGAALTALVLAVRDRSRERRPEGTAQVEATDPSDGTTQPVGAGPT